ncbi:HAD hydrolase-like protein [Puniceicoccaceae bacterium K14]|nr:HAD hydrolase-like protein [Puniceicoccaceae bacterium K14]
MSISPFRLLLVMPFALFSGVCSAAPVVAQPVAETAVNPAEEWVEMPNDLHWVRNSAEYKALTRQVYRQAEMELLKLKESGILDSTKNWAVALDADETILDNSLFAKEQRGAAFDPVAWNDWCRRIEAPAVPGSLEFLNLVKELGGKIAVVTNRSVVVTKETKKNLKRLGVDFDVILLKDEESDKHPRWDLLKSGKAKKGLEPLELLMFFGDNIHDFPDTHQDLRNKDTDAYSLFGIKYFVLPNPTYGSFPKNPKL